MERKRLGLDKPLMTQFSDWMVGMATLDFGNLDVDRAAGDGGDRRSARAVAAGRHHGDADRGAARHSHGDDGGAVSRQLDRLHGADS